MILLPVIVSVAILVALIAGARLQPFIAFVIAAIAAALMLGVPLAKIPGTVEHGIGDLLGSLSIIIVLGAMFGKLIADSGAAQQIARTMIAAFGESRVTLAMTATGFIVGIPLFYNVGFVLMVPLIFSVMYRTRLSAVYLGIPLLAGLSTAHGFLPPHPSPTALVAQFHADIGKTLLYGLVVAIPALLMAGPLFASTLKNVVAGPVTLFKPAEIDDAALPGVANSFACAVLPVLLIAGATLLGFVPGLGERERALLAFLGNPTIVMLIALTIATVALGLARGTRLTTLMDGYGAAVRDIAGILLIIAGGGALKQVFIDSGVNDALGATLASLPLPPLVLGWLVALVIRIALGSATVAGLTAAGIVQPLVARTGADPNLMVLAVGAGSLMCSHVNDSGFWMFKEYFNLSLRDTFRSWSLMETIVGSVGLVLVLILDAVI